MSIEVGPNDNDAPVAGDDAYTTDEDTPLVVPASGVLADDTDPDAVDVLTVVLPAGAPTHGTLTLNGDGSFTYVPDADYHGTDTFTYAVVRRRRRRHRHGHHRCRPRSTTTRSATADTQGDLVVDEDGTLVVPAAGVLANDSDVDGDPLTRRARHHDGPRHR